MAWEPFRLAILQKFRGEEKADKQNTHERIWRSVCLLSVLGTVWGESPRHLGRPDLFLCDSSKIGQNVRGTDETLPRDKRDTSTEGLAIQKMCLAKFLYVS